MANYLWLYGFVSEDCKSHFLLKICAVWRDQCSSPSLISRAATSKLTAEGWGRLAPWRAGQHRTTIVFSYLWRHHRVIITEIDMGEYGDGRSTSSRDALSDNAMRFIDKYSVLFVCSMNHIPPYIIHVCHDSTMMTSETSENTIRFSVSIWFSFTLF